MFWNLSAITIDKFGNIYTIDNKHHRIRKITQDGRVSTLAGSTKGYKDGAGISAQFDFSEHIFINAKITCNQEGVIYITEPIGNRIRKITPNGNVSTLSSSVEGYADGNISTARFCLLSGITCDPQNNLYVSDCRNQRVRKIDPSGIVSTLAGNGIPENTDGIAHQLGYLEYFRKKPSLNRPAHITSDHQGNLYVHTPEPSNRANFIRKITQDFKVSTINSNHSSRYEFPTSFASNKNDTLYIILHGHYHSSNSKIIKLTANGNTKTIVGENHQIRTDSNKNHPLPNPLLLEFLSDMTIDREGNLYFIGRTVLKIGIQSYESASIIYKVSENGAVSLFAPPMHSIEDGIIIELAEQAYRLAHGKTRVQPSKEFVSQYARQTFELKHSEDIEWRQIQENFRIEEIYSLINPYVKQTMSEIRSVNLLENPHILKTLDSPHYHPRKIDLFLFNQLYFFVNSDERYNHLSVKIRYIILRILSASPQIKHLTDSIISITASDSIDDLISNWMVFPSSTTEDLIAVISYDYFRKFLLKSKNEEFPYIEISSLFVYEKLADGSYQNVGPSSLNLSDIFKKIHIFRSLLISLYNAKLISFVTAIFQKHQSTLNIIISVLAITRTTKNYSHPEEQIILSNLINPLLISNSTLFETKLHSSIIEKIHKIFEYAERSEEERSILYLGLAYFFVELSSAKFLGNENNSPMALRIFAVGLLNQISDTRILPQIPDWKNRLLGLNHAFTCTEVLGRIMHGKIMEINTSILDIVQPITWK